MVHDVSPGVPEKDPMEQRVQDVSPEALKDPEEHGVQDVPSADFSYPATQEQLLEPSVEDECSGHGVHVAARLPEYFPLGQVVQPIPTYIGGLNE